MSTRYTVIGCKLVLGLVLVLGTRLALAWDDRQDKPATPAEQYQALLAESHNAPDDLSKAKSDEERKSALARLRALPQRFLELAEKNPRDPVAVEALIQTVVLVNGSAFPAGGEDSPGYRALAILRRDHVESDKLGPVCQHVVFGFHRSHETFLRVVLETCDAPDEPNGPTIGRSSRTWPTNLSLCSASTSTTTAKTPPKSRK